MRRWLVGGGVAAVVLAPALLATPLLLIAAAGGGGTSPAAAVAVTCPAVAPGPGEAGSWDAEQVANATVIVNVGRSLGIPPRGWLIGIATAMQESRLRNLDYGDGTSVGLFQLIAIHGTVEERIDPTFSATWFFRGLKTITGWESMPLTEAAQAVQRSAFPLAYADDEAPAAELLKAITGITDPCPAVPSGPWAMPVAGYVISDGFAGGYRSTGGHSGLDLAVPAGTPVTAASAGVLYWTGWGGPYGNLAKIRHAGGVETWYAHLSAFTMTPGPVTPGQQIAASGSTGNSTGPHLHFEVRVSGLPVDPQTWLVEHGVTP